MIEIDPSEPANYFALAEDLRGRRGLRRRSRRCSRREDAKPNDHGRLHAAGRLLQPPGPLRQDDGSAEPAGVPGSDTTRRATTPSPSTTGTRPSATRASRRHPERVHQPRAWKRSTRPSPSSRTTGGDRLQGPAAPARGASWRRTASSQAGPASKEADAAARPRQGAAEEQDAGRAGGWAQAKVHKPG